MQALSIIVRIGDELCEGFGAQTRRKDRYNAFQARVILGLLATKRSLTSACESRKAASRRTTRRVRILLK